MMYQQANVSTGPLLVCTVWGGGGGGGEESSVDCECSGTQRQHVIGDDEMPVTARVSEMALTC